MTWLVDSGIVGRLHQWVAARMTEHHHRGDRAASPESVGPWSVDGLVADVMRFGRASNWIWASTALCQLQELVFCANDGGIKASRNVPAVINKDVNQLRLVRNALMHPAFSASSGADVPHVELLRPHLERDEDFRILAETLGNDRSLLASRPITVFTLRRVNSTVRDYLRVLAI